MFKVPPYSQDDFLRVCRRFGLEIIMHGGKGSHVKVKNLRTGTFIIVPRKIKKGLDVRLIKDLERWGFDREEIVEMF